MLCTDFGVDVWHAVLAQLGLTPEQEGSVTDPHVTYEDALTVKAVSAACAVLNVEWDDAMRVYGRFFVRFLHTGKHLRMFHSMGDSLIELLNNVNQLHFHLERTHRSTNFPVFHVETEEGDEGSCILSYSSVRGDALVALLEGIVPQAGLLIYFTEVDMERLPKPRTGYNASWRVCAKKMAPDDAPFEECVRRCFHAGVLTPTAEHASFMSEEDLEHLASSAGAAWHSALTGKGGAAVTAEAVGVALRAPIAPGSCSESGNSPWPVERAPSMDEACATPWEDGGSFDAEQKRVFDELQSFINTCPDPEMVTSRMMRAVPASRVTSEWFELDRLAAASAFWASNHGSAADFALSHKAETATRFISHSWRQPDDWVSRMGTRCRYADVKATELDLIARDLSYSGVGLFRSASLRSSKGENLSPVRRASAEDGVGSSDMGETSQHSTTLPAKRMSRRNTSAAGSYDRLLTADITFWVDKACVPQGHPIAAAHVARIEDFIKRSDGMVVLFSWHYFTRLWCVYEWACFLVWHEPQAVQVCAGPFLRPNTIDAYFDAIERFTVFSAKCDVPGDHKLLESKVHLYYNSAAAFEEFAKVSAIGLLAVSVVESGRPAQAGGEVAPWLNLARRLGFDDLADALSEADVVGWRANAKRKSAADAASGADEPWSSWQTAFVTAVDDWFDLHINPVLIAAKRKAVKPEFFNLSAQRSSRSSSCVSDNSKFASRVSAMEVQGELSSSSQTGTPNGARRRATTPGGSRCNAPGELTVGVSSKPSSARDTPPGALRIPPILEALPHGDVDVPAMSEVTGESAAPDALMRTQEERDRRRLAKYGGRGGLMGWWLRATRNLSSAP